MFCQELEYTLVGICFLVPFKTQFTPNLTISHNYFYFKVLNITLPFKEFSVAKSVALFLTSFYLIFYIFVGVIPDADRERRFLQKRTFFLCVLNITLPFKELHSTLKPIRE